MAQLALGFAGAAVGSFFGPLGTSIGWAIGSAVGGALFGPKAPDGPRITDKRLQLSQYGQMIPWIWGRERIAGVVIDQTDLTEHSHESSGKGQSGPTTYTYTASFAIAMCEGPIIGLRRIWADGRVIYDKTGATGVDNSKVPITIYLGTETQLPDPTFEAIHGTGNVPAYRGTAYVVFTDWDLADFYNRIPNLEFEVFTHAGAIPWQVCEIEGGTGITGAFTDPAGHLVIGDFGDLDDTTYTEKTYTLDGALVSTTTAPMEPLPFNGSSPNLHNGHATVGAPIIAATHSGTFDDNFDAAWYFGNAASQPFTPDTATDGISTWVVRYDEGSALYQDDQVYSVFDTTGNGRYLARWPAPGGFVGGFHDLTYGPLGNNISNIYFGSSDTGKVYVRFTDATDPGDVLLREFSADLELLRSWTVADLPVLSNTSGYFVVYNGMLALTHASGTSQQKVILYDLESLSPSSTTIGELEIGGLSAGGIARFSNGLCVVSNGVISLDPPVNKVTLAEIVGDCCDEAGLDSSQRDVSELVDEITGFKLTRQGSLRTAIETLQPGYQFDAVERDVLVAFPKRGKEPVVTIPVEDLAAVEAGGDQPTPREYTHGNGGGLPRQVSVSYEEEDADYQPGSQYEQRRVGDADSNVTIELPVAMDAKTARAIAETNLLQAHVERDAFACSTSRKYLVYEPTDVVLLIDRPVMLKEKDHDPIGVVSWKGVAALQSLYVGTAKASPGDGFQEPSARSTQPTDLVLLDIPLIQDPDANGIYVAMAGATDSTWRGATLYKSSDGGASYASVVSVTVPSTMGTTSDVLGNFDGGNVFDESNTVTVVISNGGGSLSSATELGVLNGANLAAIGSEGRWELLQFRDATLTATNTYRLSGLLRGRRGTEWAMPSHQVGDRFVLLSTTTRIDALTSELGVDRLYKAVSSGQALSDAEAHSFSNTGNALLPYSPAQVSGAEVDPFDGAVEITWHRRTRVGGAWSDLVDVPLSETTEGYVVQIWNSSFTEVARIIETTSESTTYSAADQTTDFGDVQQNVYATVGQKGAYSLGTQTKVVIEGSGTSDDEPIAPIQPYNAPPPPSTSGCTLPTQTSSFTWASPSPLLNASAGPTKTWVISFTTPASPTPGAGSIAVSEYAGPPVRRDAVLALSPCGAQLAPGAKVHGNTATVFFYLDASTNPNPAIYPTLLPSTTYYFSVDSAALSGAICNLNHA